MRLDSCTGFQVTNRGPAGEGERAFLSQDPSRHPQIAMITRVPVPDRAFDVVVSFGPDMRNDAETFQGLSLRAASGEPVALGQLARVETVSVPRSLYRQQMLRAILISCEVRAGDRAQAMAEIKRTIATYPLPVDYHVKWD